MTLVAGWNFDEGSGTVARDATGNGHDATFAGGSIGWTAPGMNGSAAMLTGTGSYASVPRSSSIEPTSAFTWMCKAKLTEESSLTHTFMALFSKSRFAGADSIALYGSGSTSGVPQATITTSAGSFNAAASSPYTAGVETHYAVVYDGAHVWLVIDGVTDGTPVAATGTVSYDNATGFTMLGSAAFPGEYGLASIDDMRMYDTAMTDSEIAAVKDVALVIDPAATADEYKAVGGVWVPCPNYAARSGAWV